LRIGEPSSTDLFAIAPMLAGSYNPFAGSVYRLPRRRSHNLGVPFKRRGFQKGSQTRRGANMTNKKVWFITGAGRGMGVDFARAALGAGHSVVAAGRNVERVRQAIGAHDELLVVSLDITAPTEAVNAVELAVNQFGRIDVLVNNAGNFYAGFFEELSQEQVEQQVRTNLFGPMNVTRAVLPVMRKQRSGQVVTLSSMAGLVGQEFCSAYAASKFGVEGWMESLRFEIEPFGIRAMIVEPGFFRTDLLEAASTTWAALSIDDYAERTAQIKPAWKAMSGRQSNDPAKLARALVALVDSGEAPLRWIAGADALPTAEQKARDLLAQIEAHRTLSASLAIEGTS
jgi:NAD(P)-dependent dehydrogenase (short-subunit alcohol dehydrogenase family)